MFVTKCRCGKSEKSFKRNIGPFFMNDCCVEAGYDERGNLIEQKSADKQEPTVQVVEVAEQNSVEPTVESQPVAEQKSEEPIVEAQPVVEKTEEKSDVAKLSKGKLKDMRVADLKLLAKERGIEGAEEMTKVQLVDALSK